MKQTGERGKTEEGKGERAWRWARNWNAVGAVALGGLAVIVPAGAALNGVQAGASEAFRRRAKKSRSRRKS